MFSKDPNWTSFYYTFTIKFFHNFKDYKYFYVRHLLIKTEIYVRADAKQTREVIEITYVNIIKKEIPARMERQHLSILDDFGLQLLDSQNKKNIIQNLSMTG